MTDNDPLLPFLRLGEAFGNVNQALIFDPLGLGRKRGNFLHASDIFLSDRTIVFQARVANFEQVFSLDLCWHFIREIGVFQLISTY